MNRVRTGFLSALLISFSIAFLLPACNQNDRPLSPGTVFAPTPVPCSGVLGNNAVESVNPGPPDLVFVFVVPGSNTTLSSLSIYTTASTSVTYEAGIYSDNLGAPANLLVETGPQTVSAPATMWNNASLTHPINLSASVTYWLAFQSTGYLFGPTGSGAAFGYQPVNVYGSLPSIFSGVVQSSTTFAFSIYGTTCP
jgi:hypothetical protein